MRAKRFLRAHFVFGGLGELGGLGALGGLGGLAGAAGTSFALRPGVLTRGRGGG